MPKISAKQKTKGAEVSLTIALEAGTKKLRLDPRFSGSNSVFKLPQIYMKAVSARSLTEIRAFAEQSRQYMVDRIYAGKAAESRKVIPKPHFPTTQPGAAQTKPFDLEPLTKKYRRWKRRRKLDGRILVAVGEYTKALQVKKVKRSGTDVTYLMTISPQKRHKGGSLFKRKGKRPTLRQLAAMLEFGSAKKKLPPRPHWKPTAKEMTRRFKKAPQKMLASAMRDFLRKSKGA